MKSFLIKYFFIFIILAGSSSDVKGDDEDDVHSEQAIGFVQAVLLPGVACVSRISSYDAQM